MPTFQLDDVVLLDPARREALRLPKVGAAVSVRSLVALKLRFEQLLIEAPQLEVRRDPQGRLWVAGLRVDGGNAGDTTDAADWFFEQHEFVIRHGLVRWVDETRDAPPLALHDVSLVVRNGLRHHNLRLDATPDSAWGDPFTVRARFTQPLLARAGDWRRYTGVLHADMPHADLAALRRHLTLPFDLAAGDGAVRAWIDVAKGQARAATIDLALRAVDLRLERDADRLQLSGLTGRLSMQRDAKGVSISARDIEFALADGRAWPASNVHVAWQQKQDLPSAPMTGGEFEADRLDLGLMAEVAERLPVGRAVRKLLGALAPRGEAFNLAARWEGSLDAPRRYDVKARLQDLSLASEAAQVQGAVGRPGWRNARIELQASEKGGNAVLNLDGGALEFPGVFEEPVVPLHRFNAQLAWRIDRGPADQPSAIELKVKDARFSNADADGELNATWRTGAGTGTGQGGRFPGVLDMSGHLSRARGPAVARYLPLSIPEGTRRYVERAVVGGRVDGASFKVKGDLWQFPFASARDGVFHIAGLVSDVTLAYVPPSPGGSSPWPAFDHVSGELVFDRTGMEIRNAQAAVLGYQLTQVQGGIRNLADKPTLVISGNGRGELADALRYVNASPVGEWIGRALHDATTSGMSELTLALNLPLHDLAQSAVKGSVLLTGNDVRLWAGLPLLAQARARVDFTHKGFTISSGNARVMGGSANFEGGSQGDGSLRFTAQGMASAEGLRQSSEWPLLARVATSFNGQTAYRLDLNIVRGHTEILLTSPLTGLGLDLPPPLRKSAEVSLPLRVQTQLMPDAGGLQDTLRIELGTVLQAQYQRDLSGDAPRVLRGAIAVQEPLPPLAPSVPANASLGLLDVDAWDQMFLDRDSAAAGPESNVVEGDYVPRQIALRAQELRASGRRLTHVVAGISSTEGDSTWRVNVVADQLSGYLEYRPSRNASGSGRVVARLARLSLPRSENQGEAWLD
ncbi:MAG TPA: DUF3971 domain-containing protein, partial [Burkholderiaceae bacterium]|nr:DUF3971 domain-containing protein [Burkholderiaceae bacterium]